MRLNLTVPAFLSIVVTAVGATARAQGIPQDGFPNWQERTMWVFVNRDRADPETALLSCTVGCPDAFCYKAPLIPLAYNLQLSHSARLQPTILAENNVTLMHPSPCVLNPDIAETYPDECDGGTDCVCQTPVQCSFPPNSQDCLCGEDTSDTSKFENPDARIRLFAPGSSVYAENLAAGQVDPQVAESWLLDENCTCCPAFACVAIECPADGGTNGHRANLMSTAVNSIGLGAVEAPQSDCYHTAPASYYWGQDFAFFDSAVVLKIVAGSHFPQSGTSLSFYANWFDPQDGAPKNASVIIDSQSHAMTVDRGSGGNATYVYDATLPTGSCKPYSFAFTDAAGNAVTLPVSGTYLAGDKCSADYAVASGCATGAGEPWFGGLLLAAGLLRSRVKFRVRSGVKNRIERRASRNRGRMLTKWQ
jgi:hypothetical protein